MMKKGFIPHLLKGAGFTLLELVVVIIILGVLATLGITQYGVMVERMRIAEVKTVFADMRKLAIAYRLANGTVNGITNADVNIGPGADQIPQEGACRSTHYFGYLIINSSGGQPVNSDPNVGFEAQRCLAGGKKPQRPNNWYWIILWSNLSAGTDRWDVRGP